MIQNVIKKNEVFNLEKKVVDVNRVIKVAEGGRKFRISALVVVGNGAGIIGYGIGKSNEVAEAVKKGENSAKKKLIKIPLLHKTIPHEVYGYYDGSYVFLKPATQGTGVKAGGVTMIICELAGIENILSKNFRRNSKHNSLKATFCALQQLRDPISISKLRGVPLSKVFNG